MAIKAVIFDCFGVLYADPVTVLIGRCQSTEQASALQNAGRALHHGAIPLADFIDEAVVCTGLTGEEVHKYMQHSLMRYEAVFAYVRQLKQRGLKVAVLSNIDSGSVARFFSQEERTTLFDAVMVSGSMGVAKPQPAAYHMTVAELGVQPAEVIMIDDWRGNVDGAIAAGLHGVEFTSLADCQQQVEELTNA